MEKMSIGIDFGIGIDQNSWYRTGIVSKPKKLVSPITTGSAGKFGPCLILIFVEAN
jgi:hypothetical protein